jgi:hypothetical protein
VCGQDQKRGAPWLKGRDGCWANPQKVNDHFTGDRMLFFTFDPQLTTMTARTILILRVVLGAVALLIGFRVYRIIMEPIEFQAVKDKRYVAVITQLEQLREAQLAFKNEYGMYANDVTSLVDFVTNAQVTIVERKDSSFMKYNKVYQTDMMKDTIIYRVIGSAPAITKLRNQREDLFPEDFDPKTLLSVRYSQDSTFKMGTAVVEKNGIKVPVFEIKASNRAIFGDVYDQYKSYIKRLRTQDLIVGSLTEPTLSGNWK